MTYHSINLLKCQFNLALRNGEMERTMKKKFVQIVSLVLTCLLLAPLVATAVSNAQPPVGTGGHTYVDVYGNVIYVDESGVSTVIGTGYIDENGVLILDGTGGDNTGTGGDNGAAEIPGTVPPGTTTGIGNPVIRVGIYYGSAGKQSVDLKLTTGNGFRFGYYGDESCENFVAVSAAETTQITVTALIGSGIMITDTQTGALLYQHDEMTGMLLAVVPYSSFGEKTVTKCGYPYYGAFRFERIASYPELLTIVNVVTMDDYLKGVVPYEASPSWPIEALKAQAVCARSYALTHINSSHQRNYHFDLCDSDDCQVYKGVYSGSQKAKAEEAVDSTSGVTMQYNGEYCDALYSSSNGGASESAVNVWGKEVPYLQGKEDPYEALVASSIPNYNWTKRFTGEELQAKLIAAGRISCGVITEVKTKLSATGNVIELTFTDNNGKNWTVYNNECRTFLSLRSLRYTVSSDGTTTESTQSGLVANGTENLDVSAGITVINGDGTISVISSGYLITAGGVEEIGAAGSGGQTTIGASGTVFDFNGTGWGHNVGMSQYGAYAMAQQGYTYERILQFYYTGVTIG